MEAIRDIVAATVRILSISDAVLLALHVLLPLLFYWATPVVSNLLILLVLFAILILLIWEGLDLVDDDPTGLTVAILGSLYFVVYATALLEVAYMALFPDSDLSRSYYNY